MAFDAAKALICKQRRDSQGGQSDVDDGVWKAAPPDLEEMDWLSGPEGEEWLTKLRVSATPPGEQNDNFKFEMGRSLSHCNQTQKNPDVGAIPPLGQNITFKYDMGRSMNDENQSINANIDRRQAMALATKDAKAAPVFTPALSTLQPILTRCPSVEAPSMPLGPPPTHVPGRGRSFGRSASMERAPSFPSQTSFNLGPPVRAVASRIGSQRQGSFRLGPVAQGVTAQALPPRSAPAFAGAAEASRQAPAFAAAAEASRQLVRSLSRGAAPEGQLSRSLSRGPLVDSAPSSRHAAAPVASAKRAHANVGDQLLRAQSVDSFRLLDDAMPAPAHEVASMHASVKKQGPLLRDFAPPTRSKSASIFWRPPPEAAVLCEAIRSPSFVAQASGDAPHSAGHPTSTRPPMAQVVAVPSFSHQPSPVPLHSHGPPPGDAAAPPRPAPRLLSQHSFPSAESFVPLPRMPSSSFAPEPRQL